MRLVSSFYVPTFFLSARMMPVYQQYNHVHSLRRSERTALQRPKTNTPGGEGWRTILQYSPIC